jgi:hypothetical protein
MGWLEDLTKPLIGRVWQAFFGFGYEMKVVICERPHVPAKCPASVWKSGNQLFSKADLLHTRGSRRRQGRLTWEDTHRSADRASSL